MLNIYYSIRGPNVAVEYCNCYRCLQIYTSSVK